MGQLKFPSLGPDNKIPESFLPPIASDDPNALKTYDMANIPPDAVAPYLVVDKSVEPAELYYEDGT